MRILTTILFLTLSILPSFGIWSRVSHSDSIEINHRVDSIVTIYLSDSRWSKVKSEYNENGKKVREFLYSFSPRENRELYLQEKYDFIYDTNNKLIEKYEVCCDFYPREKGNKGIAKTIYKYDTRGNKVAEYHQYKGYDKGKCVLKEKWNEKWKYNYNAKENEVIEYSSKVKVTRQVCRYDSEGYLLRKTNYSSYYEESKYPWRKNRIEYKTEESFYNIYGIYQTVSFGIPSNRKDIDTTQMYRCMYDEYFNKTETINLRYSYGERFSGKKTEFIYDNNGKKQEEITYPWSRETKDWAESAENIKIYTYDNNGNLLQETEYEIRENYRLLSKQTIYAYNEKGEIITRNKITYKKNYETKEYTPLLKEEYELKEDRTIENYYGLDVWAKDWNPTPYRTDIYYFSQEK